MSLTKEEVHKSSRRFQEKNGPIQVMPGSELHQGTLPAQRYTAGRYIKPDLDDEMRFQTQQAITSSKRFGEPVIMNDAKDLTDRLIDARKEEERFNAVQFMSYFVDPRRPETQDQVYKWAPEIKTANEKLLEEDIDFAVRLHTLIRTGQALSRNDALFLFNLCREDFFLPMGPLWDPPNGLLADKDVARAYKRLINMNLDDSLFGKYKFNPRALQTERLNFNRAIKAKIIQRCVPGLRELTDDQCIEFVTKFGNREQGDATIGNNGPEVFGNFANNGPTAAAHFFAQ